MASSTTKIAAGANIFNVPNQVTAARLVLTIVMFVFLALGWFLTSFVLFLVAASTDWLDGYYARRYGQVTQLGRILDPFADKMVICGTFIFLAAIGPSGVAAWMAVLIMGRELLVTALRSFLEHNGCDFSATRSGKIKMVVQCIAIGFCLFRLTYLDAATGAFPATTSPPDWMTWGMHFWLWSAVVITVYSGVEYIFAALRLMRG